MPEKKCVTLDNLADGAAKKVFGVQLTRVLENIEDQNTVATATREITLKVKISPNEERDMGIVQITASSKMAPGKAAKTIFFLGREKNIAVARERDPDQMTFDDVGELVSIDGGKLQ